MQSLLQTTPLVLQDDTGPGRMSSARLYLFLLAVILSVSVAAQWFYYQPKLNTDAQVWLNIAKNLWSGRPLEYSVFYYERIYFTGFLSLLGLAFPLTAEGILPAVLILSGINIVLVAEISRQAAGRRAAIFSAALFGFHPIVLTYSTFLVSDTLALPAALLTLLCITMYLKTLRFGYILAAAVLGGACFFIKSYTALFGLIAILVYAATWIWGRGGSWPGLMALCGAILLPVLLGHVIHWQVYGDPFFYKNYYDDYARRVYGTAGISLQNLSSGETAKIVLERFEYLSHYFDRSGVFAAVWSLLVAAFLLISVRSSYFHATIAFAFFFLSLFLSFAPVRLAPLVFVEIQARYLTLPLALLAIGAGLLVRAYPGIDGTAFKRALFATAAIFAAGGLLVPNSTADDYFHRYRVHDYHAIKKAAMELAGRSQIILPSRYGDMFLEDLSAIGTPIQFVDMSSSADADKILAQQPNCSCSYFIPRVQYPVLADRIRVQSITETSEYGDFEGFASQLAANGFKRSPLTVPYTPGRLLADRLGLRAKGELVGWLFTKPGTP